MTVKLNTTEHDHIPEDFTLESLMASGLTEAEVKVLTEGDDSIIAPPVDTAPHVEPTSTLSAAPPVTQETATAPANTAPAVEETLPPPPQLPDTTQAQAHLDALKNEAAQIRERYDSGELAPDEFDAELERITAARAQATATIQQAQQVIQQHRQTVEQQWFAGLDAYHKTPGFDVLTSPQHINGWDQALRAVSGHPELSKLPMQKQFELAHQTYAATWNTLNPAAAIPTPAQRVSQTQPAPQQVTVNGLTGPRTDKRPDPVATLASLPASGEDAISDGTFAALDRITDPLEHERAFARLTPDMQAAYLASV